MIDFLSRSCVAPYESIVGFLVVQCLNPCHICTPARNYYQQLSFLIGNSIPYREKSLLGAALSLSAVPSDTAATFEVSLPVRLSATMGRVVLRLNTMGERASRELLVPLHGSPAC